MRINFDLESEPGIRKFRVFLIARRMWSLSTADPFPASMAMGRRAVLLPKMFGPELMQAFREFKALWDPVNRMNPGKLMDPVNGLRRGENLRRGLCLEIAPQGDLFSISRR